jgi:hypothetical protein
MTSCAGESLQDWEIRTEPGDGGDIRPEKGGDSLSLFPHGRDKSSSSAELREEVLEPRVFACMEHVSHWDCAKQSPDTCLGWREFVVHLGG